MLTDLRFALRALARSPGFTAVAVAMLALGIGASTACFSFLHAFFLRPPPFERPAELVSVHMVDERTPGLMRLSYPNFTDYRAQTSAFTGLAFHMYAAARYAEGDQASDHFGQLVSADFFDVLGVRAAVGRMFTADDDRAEGAPPVAVVSHAFWQTRLGANPAALGRPLLLNGTPFTLVGVAPAGFRGVNVLDAPEFWVPESSSRLIHTGPALEYFLSRRAVTVSAVGRLRPGVTLAQAEASLEPVTRHLAAQFPADNAGRSVRLVPVAEAMIDPNQRTGMLRAGYLLLALSGLILLIACANVANLLLARAGARRREFALRVALGGSRRQVVQRLLAEHVLLAGLGGALGVVAAHWLRDLLWALRPDGFAGDLTVAMDGGVLAFAVATTLVTGLLFGLGPALAATRVDLVGMIKREPAAGGASPLLSPRHVLVAAQVALSVVALVVAGLFVRSLYQANVVALGWNSRGLTLLSAGLQREGYDQARSLEYYRRALERLRAVPGVLDAGVSTRPFLTGVNPQRTIRPQGAVDEALRTQGQLMSYACVLPGYFRLLGIGLVAGRDFAERDDSTRPLVVIVNETLARRAWPGEDPLGKTVKLYNSENLVQVVGVVRDIRDTGLRADPAPFAYFPLTQQFSGANAIHVRTAGDPGVLLPVLRRELQALERGVPIPIAATYDDLIRRLLWDQRTGAALMSAFGAIALLLASLGLYAVMAHAVGQRTREIGIRLAVGAPPRAVVALVLRRGVVVAGAGLLAGLGASLALTRYLRSFLFEVAPSDPLTFAVIAVVLGAIALLACYLPARRATRVDPLVALRTE